MVEKFIDIKGYEGLYQISDLGRVKRLKNIILKKDRKQHTFEERILKPSKGSMGFLRIGLSDRNHIRKTIGIHKLVGLTFLEKKENDTIIIHINKNKLDNRLCNLRYAQSYKYFDFSIENLKEYETWAAIKSRCYGKNRKDYKNYGGRGIVVCDEWKDDFNVFYDWSKDSGYKEGLTIDRIENNGNYEPLNCRWATRLEQSNNQRSNKILEYNGIKKSMAQWCRELELNYDKIRGRLLKGWTTNDAFEKA